VVRERIGSLLRLSALLFFLALVAAAVASSLGVGLFWILHQRRMHPSIFTTQSVSFLRGGLTLLVLSRFGLALPALLLDNCRVGQAMFRSDELTEGKCLTLVVLLAKSLIGGPGCFHSGRRVGFGRMFECLGNFLPSPRLPQ
jgi:hypothetical protein